MVIKVWEGIRYPKIIVILRLLLSTDTWNAPKQSDLTFLYQSMKILLLSSELLIKLWLGIKVSTQLIISDAYRKQYERILLSVPINLLNKAVVNDAKLIICKFNVLELKLFTNLGFFGDFSVYMHMERFNFHSVYTVNIVVWFWVSAYSREKRIHLKHLTNVYLVFLHCTFFKKFGWLSVIQPTVQNLHLFMCVVHFLSSEKCSVVASLMCKVVKLWGASNSHWGQNSPLVFHFLFAPVGFLGCRSVNSLNWF